MSQFISQAIAVLAICIGPVIAFGAVMWRLGTKVQIMEATIAANEAKRLLSEERMEEARAIIEKRHEDDLRDIKKAVDQILLQQATAQGIAIGIAQQQAHKPSAPTS